jgi:hypothetical protein
MAAEHPSNKDAEDVDFRYWAFISYSHSDEAWATWLHRSLERYRLPRGVAGSDFRGEKVPTHLRPVFLDRDELAGGSDLGGKLRRSLRESRTLIVICSPKSAASKWVEEEVRYFKSLGREDRVLCLIVSGEPYAIGTPGHEAQECFPNSIRFRLYQAGAVSSEPAEPLAADVRPGKDGKTSAILKLVAGILDIGFDRLRQREARRKKLRRMQWSIGSVSGVMLFIIGYLLLADYGVSLPGRDAIQLALDKRDISVMRAVPADAEVAATAEELRGKVINAIYKAKSDRGWISQTLRKGEENEFVHDACSHPQAIFALSRLENHEPWSHSMLRQSTLLPFAVQEGKSVSFFTEVFNPPEISLRPIDSCGAFWIINMLASSHGDKELTNESQKPEVEKLLYETQQVLEAYRTESGGWRMFPGAEQTAPANSYSTSLALLALLECRKAGLPWLGSEEIRDQRLKSSVEWLHKHFHQDAKAAGWRGTGENRYEVFDGLTLQVYATLLRARHEAGVPIPLRILHAMEHHLIDCVNRSATYPVASGEFESEIVIAGQRVQRKEAYRFLWYPWALIAMDDWLEMAKIEPQPRENVVRIRRARAHLLTEVGPDIVETIEDNWLFIAAETLYGLSPVPANR